MTKKIAMMTMILKKKKESKMTWQEFKDNIRQLNPSTVLVLSALVLLFMVGAVLLGWATSQIFCLVYWWLTGDSLAWGAVWASGAVVTALVQSIVWLYK